MADCNLTPKGDLCPEASSPQTCSPWDFNKSRDQCYIDSLIQQAVQIAGADINVYKLLGVHEQTKLIDLTGDGSPLSGGDAPNYPVLNAFTTFNKHWKSKQTGQAVIQSAYIGYDFGLIKISTDRPRYGIDTSIRQHITAIKIKQSSDAHQRITKARVERSEDGMKWYGVSVINLPNDDKLNLISFKQSVPSRFWRIRPLTFVGDTCDAWGVQALELFNYQVTAQNNIEDLIFLENRNRDYASQVVHLKGYYDNINIATELSRFGIELPSSTYQIKIHFNACVATLGRPLVIGDILQLPSETQYTPDLKPILKYVEVTDVSWDPSTNTPGWRQTMLLITAQQAMATQETQDIFGDLGKQIDSSGLFNNDDGNNTVWQDYSTVDQTIRADALTATPERGSDGSDVVRQFEEFELETAATEGFPHLNKIGLNPTGLYVEDAIPPNKAAYTESPDFPNAPADGDYHRLIFVGLSKDVPARLYRYSTTKGRWVYLETDRREQFNFQKEILNEYTTSTTRKSAKDIR